MPINIQEMNSSFEIKQIEDFARKNLGSHDGGHDWWHLERVRNNAFQIMEAEGSGDPVIIEIAALLHDIGDSKFKKTGSEDTGKLLHRFLSGLELDERVMHEVIYINRNLSFSNGKRPENVSFEFMIVQDADRLDAMGAIGIARAFNYGGFVNNPIFDPAGKGHSTISHFYDKLLKLKDLMNTEIGIKLAEERHRFLEVYLDQFYHEWEFGNRSEDQL
jgi:uncharacterized protein